MSKDNINHPKLALTIGGKDTVYLEINTTLSKKFSSFNAIENDLKFVINAFRLLIKKMETNNEPKSMYLTSENIESNEAYIEMTALYRSAIVTYAKAFTHSEGGRSKLDSNIFKDAKLKMNHESLLNERHNYHAHAGKSPYYSIIPIIAFSSENKSQYQLSSISYGLLYKSKIEIQEYINTVNFVLKHVGIMAQKFGDRLLSNEIKPNLDELYNKAKNPLEE